MHGNLLYPRRMHLRGVKRKPTKKPGPKRSLAASAVERMLNEVESQAAPARRRVSGKDRKFIALFRESGFRDAEAAAKSAGFVEPGIGWKLADRLKHLIDVERTRVSLGSQMELDEALRITADCARDPLLAPKDKLGFVTLVLRVHGALSDKPLDGKARRTMAREAAEVVERLQNKIAAGKPGMRARVQAAIGQRGAETTAAVSVELETEPSADEPASAAALPVIEIQALSSRES